MSSPTFLALTHYYNNILKYIFSKRFIGLRIKNHRIKLLKVTLDLIQSGTFKGGFPLRDQILEINLETSYFNKNLSVSASYINNKQINLNRSKI